MKTLFSSVGKIIFLLAVSIFLVGCKSSEEKRQEEAQEYIQSSPHALIEKPSFSFQIPETWKEIHPSVFQNNFLQKQNLYSVFTKKEKNTPAYIVVTKEKRKKDISPLEFFSRTRENTQASVFGFLEQNRQEREISGYKSQFLHFLGKKSSNSHTVEFWQIASLVGTTGIVFTAGTPQDSPDEVKQEIEGILSSLTLKE